MNAQLKIAGNLPELPGQESVVGSRLAPLVTPDAPDRHTTEAVFPRTSDPDDVVPVDREDEAQISDWIEEGGALRP